MINEKMEGLHLENCVLLFSINSFIIKGPLYTATGYSGQIDRKEDSGHAWRSAGVEVRSI